MSVDDGKISKQNWLVVGLRRQEKLPQDHKEPYELYDGITQAQWETFKKNCETEEFKVFFY